MKERGYGDGVLDGPHLSCTFALAALGFGHDRVGQAAGGGGGRSSVIVPIDGRARHRVQDRFLAFEP